MFSKLNKKMNSKKGFTLVEVIVVAVIVAVLAAVAIPLYLNYITSSSDNIAHNAGGSAASFCGACVNSGGAATVSGDSLKCDANTSGMKIPTGITMTITGKTVNAKHTKGTSTGFDYKF